MVSILVCYEDIFVLNATLLPKLKEEYGVLTESFQLACISDVEAMGQYLAEGRNLGTFLRNKINNIHLDSHMIAVDIEREIERDNELLPQAFWSFNNRIGVRV